MKRLRRAHIFKADGERPWWSHGALAPSPILLSPDRIRVFVGAMDRAGISRIAYVDVQADDPSRILAISEQPVLDLGRPGTFDDNGVFPASACRIGGRIFLYYTGFQLVDKIRYTMFGGLAIGDAHGESFRPVSEAPVVDRADEGLFFRGGPSILPFDGTYLAAYSAGSAWEDPGEGGKSRPTYRLFVSTSPDGICFPDKGTPVLSYAEGVEHALGRPQIIHDGESYRMLFAVRTLDRNYVIGYADSADGMEWHRRDTVLDLPHGAPGAWDSNCLYYPFFLQAGPRNYIFHTGNDFTRTGFGFAEFAAW